MTPVGYTALWAYPWDLADRGADRCLATIAELGYTAVSVAAAYHSVQVLLPENPRRSWHTAARSAVYFRPDEARYGALKPVGGDAAEPFAAVAPAVRAAGLELSAWTVLLHGSVATEHPEAALRPAGGPPQPGLLCPAQPVAREYAVALAAEIDERFAPDALDLETVGWGAVPHHAHAKVGVPLGPAQRYLAGLCTCSACGPVELRALDVDPDTSIDELLAAEPELAAFQRRREEAVTSLVAEIRRAVRPRVHVLHMGEPRTAGMDFAALTAAADRITILAYGPRSVQDDIAPAAQACGPDRLVAGLTLCHPETPDEAAFRERRAAARALGVDAISVYNHSLVTENRLRWAA